MSATTQVDVMVSGTYIFRWKEVNPQNLLCNDEDFVEVLVPDSATTIEELRADGERFRLFQNSPNPFGKETHIQFYLPESSQVEFSVMNMLGVTVKHEMIGFLNSGPHTLRFIPTDLDQGIYFYRIKTDHFTGSRKMLIINN
jgi:hypothetical protein